MSEPKQKSFWGKLAERIMGEPDSAVIDAVQERQFETQQADILPDDLDTTKGGKIIFRGLQNSPKSKDFKNPFQR